ncbi:MAG TPA: DUF6029 family protein [Bacteroidia bacterium]|nr:DUF6029 family protein [Bacteroidia bacterium]
MKRYLLFFCFGISISLFAQENTSNNAGEVHGNLQVDAQYYNPDSSIGAPPVPEKLLMNSAANINFTKGNFSAGIRYESYLNTIQGFNPKYKLNSIPYRYASYKLDELDVTVGNFYEQFGCGLILRSYEERGLGIDNSFDGVRLRYNVSGVHLKGLIGTQRYYSAQGPAIVRGFDGEVNLKELFNDEDATTQITVGGSFVSKYQSGDQVFLPDGQPLKVPLNVGASAARISLNTGKINITGEYAYKINDPTAVNNYIYKDGEALFFNATYSTKGFGLSVGVKRADNFSFKSDRLAGQSDLDINFIPMLAKQHTYALMAFYPYATQPTGELGYQVDLSTKLKKGSVLGGKYGTDISINYSGANGLDTTQFDLTKDSSRIGYTEGDYFIPGATYFQDFNFEISRKLSQKFKIMFMYANQVYNIDVIQGKPGYPKIYSIIGMVELSYKISSSNAIRMEMQHLYTKQDKKSWAMGLIEYGVGENWLISVQDMYNYDNYNPAERFHYYNATIAYIKSGNRIALGYGKQRAGIFCVGGVCRYVPASNGLSLAVTSSF